MGRLGCTINGDLNDSRFSEPMAWIGLYVAAASAACAVAMAIDAFHAIYNRKFWFPCKFFSLNATTLTLIAVATKLSVDLNTAMPRKQDQLAKLSSAAFICTVMGNFLPSLGSMENKELLMNLIALGIIIITVIVNTCIQLATGAIYMFCKEHAIVMFLMLVLLGILISSALTIPTTKSYFDQQYSEKYEEAMRECIFTAHACKYQKLRDDLTRFWMMAHTCSPQFVMGRLATSTASGAFCLLSTVVLAEAMLRCYVMQAKSFKFCHGESDYKWSSNLILITQIAAIGVGTIAPAFRWFKAINFRWSKKATDAWKPDFKVENYWIQKLNLWKEYPLVLGGYGRFWTKLLQNMKDQILGFSIWLQIAIVLLSKSVRLISVYLLIWLPMASQCCKRLIRLLKCKITTNSIHDGTQSPSVHSPDPDLKKYVLHLEGEGNSIEVMMKRNYNATDRWITMGRKKQPKHLVQILEDKEPSREFELAVQKFDSDHVPSLDKDFREPPNCWALPVVTLSSIAIALSSADHFHLVKDLIRSVKEGLDLIRIVEKNLDNGDQLTKIRKAADKVWLGVDRSYKWLGVDLRKMALQGRSSEEILKQLAAIAERKVMEFLEKDSVGDSRETPSKWPIQVLAANSMYRICRTLLLSLNIRESSSETLIEKLSTMISDIMGACLTNIRRAISEQCHRSTIDKREESVRYTIFLLGKTDKLRKTLDRHPLPNLEPDKLAYIDEWRASSKLSGPIFPA